jgi:hypothetical protein
LAWLCTRAIWRSDPRRLPPASIRMSTTASRSSPQFSDVRPVERFSSSKVWAWRPEVQEAVEKALEEPGISLDSPAGQEFMRKLAK